MLFADYITLTINNNWFSTPSGINLTSQCHFIIIDLPLQIHWH